jgi:Protein of unknown function (DUF2975)
LTKAAAILISFIVSIRNPEGAKNLYLGLNLFRLRQADFWQYTGSCALMLSIELLKAYTAFLVTRVPARIKMTTPFTVEVSHNLEKISYMILFIWAVVMMYNAQITWLSKRISGLHENIIHSGFILLAAIVFIFSQIFKKGVEFQIEKELTV